MPWNQGNGVFVHVCVLFVPSPVKVGDYDSVSFVFWSSRQVRFLHNCIVYHFVLYIMVKIT